MVAMDLAPEARYKDVRCVMWPRGYMVAMDLGPEARYKDVRCVKRSASKVNRVLYIPYLILLL